MKTTTFADLPVRTNFLFRGMRYEKLGQALARDLERRLVIFAGETEVQQGGPCLGAKKSSTAADPQAKVGVD